MELILCFATALLLSAVLMPVSIRMADQLHLIDFPSEDRRVHQSPIPRSGGLAIVFAVLIASTYWIRDYEYLWGFFGGSAFIVLTGYLDDRHQLSHVWKFVGQITATVAAMSGGIIIHSVPFMGLEDAPLWIAYPLTFVFILGAINAVNFTDGLDGLAAGTIMLSLGLIAAMAIQIDDYNAVLIALGVMGSLFGFLRYNTHPAKVFMGDTGSQFLGFITVCLAIIITQNPASAASKALPLLILGLPIFDTSLVICIRLAKGKSPFKPDNNHLHHQLLLLGLRHYEVVAVLYAIQAVMVVLAWNLRFENDLVILTTYCIFSALLAGTIVTMRKFKWQFRSGIIVHQPALERRNLWLRKISWINSHGYFIVEIAASLIIIIMSLAVNQFPLAEKKLSLQLALSGCLLWIGLPKSAGKNLSRLFYYCSCLFIVLGLFFFGTRSPDIDNLIDGILVSLTLFLFLSIRLTRKAEFNLDNQDILVLLIILILPLLPFATINEQSMGHITLRIAALLYAGEYVLSKNSDRHYLLRSVSIGVLFLIYILE